FIVLKNGETISNKEIQSFLKTKLASYKLPRIIEFLPELPKNATGKVSKKDLKQ
ncbi:MAG TPA: long-chain fatty acid--CoA ligase, partial [Paenibacillaceae bacterium]|nr:long-chain fatty acid--CoA ligase [Paenibacillaceae bacterium]